MVTQTSTNRTWLAAASALLFGLVLCGETAAQEVVARVNGDPITATEVAQRSRLIQVSTHKAPSRQQVVDELIDERLKMQTARRYKLEVSDSEVNTVVANMAGRMRLNTDQFAKALAGAGISIEMLKRKLRADLAWGQIVRGKFANNIQVGDAEVQNIISRKEGSAGTTYEYTLRPILFVVPRGGGPEAIMARRREAEGCARVSRDARPDCSWRAACVTSRSAMRSSGAPATYRRSCVRFSTAPSSAPLTPPDITPSGVEVFALCEKREARGDTGAERDVREQLFGERFASEGKQYLRKLRKNASIELR